MVPSIAVVQSLSRSGNQTIKIQVEVGIRNGLPQFVILGLPSPATKESRERIRMAIESSGFDFPMKTIVVNLSPAELLKKSGFLDLPIALGILLASGQWMLPGFEEVTVLGSLALDGKMEGGSDLIPVLWAFPEKKGILCLPSSLKGSFLPPGRYGFFSHLQEFSDPMQGLNIAFPFQKKTKEPLPKIIVTDSQAFALKGLILGLLGNLHSLLIGNPGTGKTYIIQLLRLIQADWNETELVEELAFRFARDASFDANSILSQRPFRSPHHTATDKALIGGGNPICLGEVSLASGGILFLDELSRFKESAIEALREPMQEKTVQISRVRDKLAQHSNFLLVAAMNPCPCGNWGGVKPCHCGEKTARLFHRKVSGPFLDRIGIEITLWENYQKREIEIDLNQIRIKLEEAVEFRKKRISQNGNLLDIELDKRMNLSIRKSEILKQVIRTIADWEGEERVQECHISTGYRFLEITKILNSTFE